MHTLKKRIMAAFVLMLFALAMVLPQTVSAAENNTLTVTGSIEGATYKLYRVGDIAADGTFSLQGDFAGYSVNLNDNNNESSKWKSDAQTLANYASRDKLAALASGDIGSDKTYTFTNLSEGVYLLVADRYKSGKYTYTFTPTLALVNGGDNSVKPKYTRNSGGGGSSDTFISVKATKVWSDNDSKNRPKSVTVQLLRNGQVYDEQTLSDANGWSYRWSGLIKSNTWTLVEKTVPDGYSVSVSQEGNNFVVTNTSVPPDYPYEPPEPEEPDNPTPPPDTPDKPNTPPDTPNKPTTPTPPSNPPTTTRVSRLPQTGALWWPVPILGISGLLMITVGVVRRKNEIDA